jgi:ABC-type antimicrobial peptide transport system permease subunit
MLAFQHAHFLPVTVWPSPAVLGCALALALVTGILFGAAPAWLVATRTDPPEACVDRDER